MATLTPSPKMQFFDANGNPLVGGTLKTYASGTSTPLVTYTDATQSTANPVSITLDARGEASVWCANALYRFILYDAVGGLIWSADDVGGETSAPELWGGVAGGTADAITFTTIPRTTSHETGQTIKFIASGDNTGAVTISPNGLPVKNLTTIGGAALSAGAIKSGTIVYTTYDGTQYQLLSLYLGVSANNAQAVSQAVTTVASASSVALASTTQNNITGTTPINAFTGTAGVTHHCKATGALPLTHHATNLIILQTGASVTLDAGATFDVYMLTSSTCEIRNIQLASGFPLADDNTIVQVVSTQTGAVATGTTILPLDDTIPQITEGTEFMTLSITPTSATNKLEITVNCLLSDNTTARCIAALFKDAVANALAAAVATTGAAGVASMLSFKHTMISGTTSAITFRVRAGAQIASTTTFNGVGGARLFGGVAASSIIIKEIAV